jgi:FG-GAP-like repeat
MGWLAVGAAISLFALAWVSMVRAGMPSFEPLDPRDVSIGPSGCEPLVDCSDDPSSIAAGDFDGDGNADVATANYFSADVSILLGDGTGSLTAAAPLSIGEPVVDIAAADLDEDGTLDLVLAVESAEALSVAFGNGDGSFRIGDTIDLRGTPAAIANPPSAVQIADMNRDGHLDLIATSLLGNQVTVVLGNGRGSFAEPRLHAVAGGPGRLAVGDLNNDGKRDVVVSLNIAAAIRVLLGDGAGNLALGDSAEVGEGPGAIVIADFDRDGKRDVAVATEDLVDSVFVLRGHGDGTFEPAEEFEVGSSPTSLVAADFDGDGRLDLITTDNFGSFEFDNSISVLAGRGDGTFEPRKAFEVHEAPIDAVAVDLNNDRKPDVVTANTETNDVSVLLNVADGPEFICAGDCDGDGRVTVTDLVVAVDLSMRGAGAEICADADVNDDGHIGVDELIRAVRRALVGCAG